MLTASPVGSFPASQLSLLIDREPADHAGVWLADDAQLTRWVLAALSASVEPGLWSNQIEVSISCASSAAIQSLNAKFRDNDKPTNVLSFPADMPFLPGSETNEAMTMILGDVVVCPEVLALEAEQQRKPVENHWAHMIVHSILHLNGLDHLDENTAEAMESLEIAILSTLEITNPYVAASAKQP